MAKDNANSAEKDAANVGLPAHPPAQRKGLLVFFGVALGIWLVILASLAAYSVWGN